MAPEPEIKQTTPALNQHWWDRAKPYVEILGVALLAVYTAFTIRMYYANRDAANAATSAATTAKATLDSSNVSFKAEERAYVGTTLGEMSNPPICADAKGLRVCANVHVVNSGRTPAVGNRLIRYATFGNDAEKTIGLMTVPPYPRPTGGLFGNIGDQYGTAPTEPVNETTADKLVKGEIPIYIYGVDQYFDVFDYYHETGFCFERVPHSTAFIYCDFGNWFDKRPITP
jgi:hypothetical protein